MTFFFISIFMILVFWRPQEWLFPFLYGFNLLDATFYIALLFFLLENQDKKLRFDKHAPQLFLLPGLWLAVLMSHIANTYFAGLTSCAVPTFKFCFFTVILFCVLDRPSRLILVGRIYVVMAITMAIHAHLQQVRGYGFAGYTAIVDHRGLRSLFFGIFEDPNDLAQMFVTALPFSFLLVPRNRFLNLLIGIPLALLLVYGVACTRSRGGYLGLMAVGGVLILLALPSRWMPRLALVGALTVLLLGPLAGAMMDDSAHDRVVFWGEANWAFKSKPLFGVGYGMIPEYISSWRSVHNAFVLCYSELGVFGYWFWFGMLQLGAVGCWRTRVALEGIRTRDARAIRHFAGIAIAALVGFAGSGYFLTRAFVYPAFFIFALSGAVPYVAQRILPASHPPLIDVRRDVFKACTIGSLASIIYIYVSIIVLNKAWMA